MDCVQEIMNNQSTSRGGTGSCRGIAGDKFGKANGSQIVGEPGCHSWELGLFLVQGVSGLPETRSQLGFFEPFHRLPFSIAPPA